MAEENLSELRGALQSIAEGPSAAQLIAAALFAVAIGVMAVTLGEVRLDALLTVAVIVLAGAVVSLFRRTSALASYLLEIEEIEEETVMYEQ